MKRKLFSIGCCLVMLLATILTSCQQEVPAPKTAVIGDVLLNDGTYVPYASITDKQKANAVAVVCGFDGNGKTLGLGLKQSGEKYKWAETGTTGYTTQFTDIVCTPSKGTDGSTENADKAIFEGVKDGSDNWNKICEKDTEAVKTAETNYPAFNWVNNYGTTYSLPEGYKDGWYIPSIAELTEIYRNKTEINAALTALGTPIASKLKDVYYLSSSQEGGDPEYAIYAWSLSFTSGSLNGNNKNNKNSVCCVRAF